MRKQRNEVRDNERLSVSFHLSTDENRNLMFLFAYLLFNQLHCVVYIWCLLMREDMRLRCWWLKKQREVIVVILILPTYECSFGRKQGKRKWKTNLCICPLIWIQTKV